MTLSPSGRHRAQVPSPVALSRCLAPARTPPGPTRRDLPCVWNRLGASFLIPLGEREFEAADQVGTEVVDERPDRAERRQQHDVDRADDRRTPEHDAYGHDLAAVLRAGRRADLAEQV